MKTLVALVIVSWIPFVLLWAARLSVDYRRYRSRVVREK